MWKVIHKIFFPAFYYQIFMAMDLEKGKGGKVVVTFSVIYDTTSHGDGQGLHMAQSRVYYQGNHQKSHVSIPVE